MRICGEMRDAATARSVFTGKDYVIYMANKKKGKKWIKWIILGAVLLLVVWIGVSIYSAVQKAKEMLADAVPSVQVTTGDISVTVQASGTIKSTVAEDIYSPLNASVAEVLVKNGDSVKTGDPILRLTSDTIDDEISSLKSSVATLDSQIAAEGIAKVSSVSAPIAGRVKAIYAEPGQAVASTVENSGALFLLSADDMMELRVPNSQDLKPGDAVTVAMSGETIDTTVRTTEDGDVVVLVPDNSYDEGTNATLRTGDGKDVGSGALKIHIPYLVTAKNGVVKSISVAVNDKVSVGSTLLRFKDSVYSDSYTDLLESRADKQAELERKETAKDNGTIVAKSDGVISGLSVAVGSQVQENMLLFTVNGTDRYELQVAVDELDIAEVAPGQTAKIYFDALPNSVYTGSVTKVSGVGVSAAGVTTYTVTLALDSSDKLMNGMSARADIETASHSGVLLVPAGALKTIDGEKYVMVVPASDEKNALITEPVQTKVTVGLFNGTQAEILTGLEEGQYVQDLTATDATYAWMYMNSSRSKEVTP